MGLTAAVLGVKVLVDGVERVLLLAAMFPRSQDVTYTLVQEGVLTLQHTHTHSLKYIITRSSSDVVISHIFYWFSPELPGLILTSPCLLKCFPALSILTQRSQWRRGGVPQSGPCVGGAGGGQTHSRTGRWFL